MKFNLHLARDHSQLALLAPNDEGEAQEAQPRLVLFVEW
jgi:hypothetical protein